METRGQNIKQLLYGSTDKFGIYQLKENPQLDQYRFEGTAFFAKMGLLNDHFDEIRPDNYELIYTGELSEIRGNTQNGKLETIFEKFNLDHPEDFRGHSLSVSDIVILHENGKNSAHFVDSYGFTRLPEFMKELEGAKEQDLDNSGYNEKQSMLQKYPAVYHSTLSYAHEHGEEEAYRESARMNTECRNAIENTLRDKTDSTSLNSGMVRTLLEQYGSERLSVILAISMARHPKWQENISPDNKAWIDALFIPLSIMNDIEVEARCDAVVLDSFIDLFRKEIRERGIETEILQKTGQNDTEMPEKLFEDGDEIIDLGDEREQVLADMKKILESGQETELIGDIDEPIPIDYDFEKTESASRIEHMAKMPEMELRENLSEKPADRVQEMRSEPAKKLAEEIDQFFYKYDAGEYRNTSENRERGVNSVYESIKNGDVGHITEWLSEVISKGTISEETVCAQELLKKLTEYKPLAKVEEMEEQNYNMIDNVLNNGIEKAQREAAKSGHGQKDTKVSLLARLAEKKAKVAAQGRNAQEKDNNKNIRREI